MKSVILSAFIPGSIARNFKKEARAQAIPIADTIIVGDFSIIPHPYY